MLQSLISSLEVSSDCCNTLYNFLHKLKELDNLEELKQDIKDLQDLDISKLNIEYKCYIIASIEYICNWYSIRVPDCISVYSGLVCPIEELDLFKTHKEFSSEEIAYKLTRGSLESALPEYKKRGIPRKVFNDAV